MNKRLIKQALI